jgi:hypothetical protein
VALGGSLVLAPAAAADPAGCTVDRPIIDLGPDGRLEAAVTARCAKSVKRYLRGEIRWDKRRAPDPLTASYTDEGTTGYDASFATCDHTNTRKYYARGFFTPGSDYHDSAHKDLTVNC